jgi:DNA invertase Pin-like site-specific DNA recombinase
MLIGYARVSTHEQNLDLQKDALQSAGCEKIFVDEVSGAVAARPGLQQAMDTLRAGDVLVVWRLDRLLGRSLRDLIELVRQLEEWKVGFRSLQESMDTSSSGGKLIFHVFGALAEFERNLIRERTVAGLSAARARGRKGGRPKRLNDKKRKLAVQLYSDGKTLLMRCAR